MAGSLQVWQRQVRVWVRWLLLMAMAAPTWVMVVLLLLHAFVQRPRRFLSRKDRSQLQLPDPCPGLQHRYLEVNGVRLHVASGGREPGRSKPLMLFAHGFPELWASWKHQLAAFIVEYEVAAVDLRGYGDSEKPKGKAQYTRAKLAGDLAALVAALGHARCVLVAHDWGGMVAWQVAQDAPHLVSRLVVMSAPHPACYMDNLDWRQFLRSWYVLAFYLPLLPELLMTHSDLAALEATFRRPPSGIKRRGAITDQDMERYKQAFARPGAATAALNYYRAVLDSLAEPTPAGVPPPRIDVPTLLLWADDDVALGQGLLRGVERYVPNIQVHVLKDCSHWIQQDQPEEVNRLMREFLRQKKLD